MRLILVQVRNFAAGCVRQVEEVKINQLFLTQNLEKINSELFLRQ